MIKNLVILITFSVVAQGQYMDPVLGPLPPLPNHLVAVRGPLYVDNSAILPAGPLPGQYQMGPPLPIMPVEPPPQPISYLAPAPPPPPPSYYIGPPVLAPPPAPAYGLIAFDETNDAPQSDEVHNDAAPRDSMADAPQGQADIPQGPSRRSANTNVQSGIQQFGTGNMNLQGNIQQITRR